MSATEVKVSDISKASPDLSASAMSALVDSIKKIGQQLPIFRMNGEVIDGRKRLEACKRAGKEPIFFDCDDPNADPKEYAIGLNLLRTHYSVEERAMYAAEIAKIPKHVHKGSDKPGGLSLTQTEAAKLMGVSQRTVGRAAALKKKGAPEVQEAVKAGKMKLGTAEKISKLPRKEQAKAVAEKTKLKPKKEGKRPKPPLDKQFTTCLQMLEGVVIGLTKHFARAKEEGKDYSKWTKALEKHRTAISRLITSYRGK